MNKPIIVSGIKPTGNLHVGNYLGAIKNWVELQNSGKYQMYIFIADLHSLTGNLNAKERHEQILKTSAELIASGIDPDKTTLFVQSHISEHTELAWIFNCVTPVSELERMTQFKDQSKQQSKNVNTGLFTYPVLQAADILLYGGQVVPVGQDQIQHVELTRDVARWFNSRFAKATPDKKYFPETKHLLTEIPKVMSLLDPEKKMSKSLGEGHVIELADEPNVIEKKLKKAVTASVGGKGAPGVQNLLLLLKQFSAQGGSASGGEEIYKKFEKAEKDGSIRYGDLKSEVGEAIAGYFSEFRAKRNELMMNHDELAEILIAGAEKARPVAEKTMEDVRRLVGIR
ncbi:tryptophan--tRNA ligase [Patescibacteria group bacterium]|nr:tryptophan--tRNA ligase [Patescibacteria group bacterium]